jgi:phosphatidate cytidylyltransferase
MLKQRIPTAVILGSIVIAIITTGSQLLFSILMGLFVLVGAWEWAGLSGAENQLYRSGYAVLTVGLAFLMFFITDISYSHGIYIIGTLWWCLASVMVVLYQYGKPAIPKYNFLKYLFGFFVLIPSTLGLVYLFGSNRGPLLVMLLFVLIWVIDSSAFLIGRCWGKKKLAYRVSPGKSWEGFIASLLAAGFMALVYTEYGLIAVTNTTCLVILFIMTAGFSVIGDLFESMYKRNVNLKDSSQLLPGHGGVLDRIDSLTAAVPVYALGLWLLETR